MLTASLVALLAQDLEQHRFSALSVTWDCDLYSRVSWVLGKARKCVCFGDRMLRLMSSETEMNRKSSQDSAKIPTPMWITDRTPSLFSPTTSVWSLFPSSQMKEDITFRPGGNFRESAGIKTEGCEQGCFGGVESFRKSVWRRDEGGGTVQGPR